VAAALIDLREDDGFREAVPPYVPPPKTGTAGTSTVPSLFEPGVRDRTFARAQDLEYDVSNGRVRGGIHFRSAVRDGVVIAKRTAYYVLAHEFRRTTDCRPGGDAGPPVTTSRDTGERCPATSHG
jgi:hypothetical protein